MSIDGLTIMINVNRKNQKTTIKQSVMCTGMKWPCCCLAAAATAGFAAWGEHPGSASWGRDGGEVTNRAPPSPANPLLGPFLPVWILITKMQDLEFAGRSSIPFECCTKAVRAPGQSLGRLQRASRASGH